MAQRFSAPFPGSWRFCMCNIFFDALNIFFLIPSQYFFLILLIFFFDASPFDHQDGGMPRRIHAFQRSWKRYFAAKWKKHGDTTVVFRNKLRLGGGFKEFWFSPLPGEDVQFDSYFSDGLELNGDFSKFQQIQVIIPRPKRKWCSWKETAQADACML